MTKKKLFFIYTIPSFMDMLYNPVMAEAFDGDAEADVSFITDSSLLKDTIANNTVPTASVTRRLLSHAQCCAEAGADCIVVGCTAMNLATAAIAPMMDVPVINVDAPVIEAVAASGCKRVAVISHARDNAETITRMLAPLGVETVELVPADAQRARASGDAERFSAVMRKAALEGSKGCDAIVLAHISSERIDFSEAGLPVFRSGEYCIKAIRKAIGKDR